MVDFNPYHDGYGSAVVECLTRDRGAGGFEPHWRRGPWARHIYPSLVLVQTRKSRPCLTERLLMGCKVSNQTNKQTMLGIFMYYSPLQFLSSYLKLQDFSFACLFKQSGKQHGSWSAGISEASWYGSSLMSRSRKFCQQIFHFFLFLYNWYVYIQSSRKRRITRIGTHVFPWDAWSSLGGSSAYACFFSWHALKR